MGSAMGNPIDEATQARINSRIQEILTTFAKEFTLAYSTVLVDKSIEELQENNDGDNLRLQPAEPPSEPLKTGILVKRGDTVKNWKPRYFILYNAADNYKIEYFDGTNETGKLKGTIILDGYRAYEFSSDDIRDFNDNGIKLCPYSSSGRTWYFKCTDDKERKEWLTLLETACYRVKSPRDEDECLAEAFDVALKNTRWYCWIWSWYSNYGTEGDRLALLIMDVLEREILYEVYRNLPDNPMRSVVEDTIRKTIQSTVRTATISAWTSAAASVRSLTETVKDTIKKNISFIVEKKEGFKEDINQKIADSLDNFLADKLTKNITPLLNILINPVINAFTEAARSFYKLFHGKINSKEFSGIKFKSSYKSCVWSINSWYGVFNNAYLILYRLYTKDLTAILSILPSDFSPYVIYNLCYDELQELLNRAAHKFNLLATGGKDTCTISDQELSSNLLHVIGLFLHDAAIVIEKLLIVILKKLISGSLTELLINPSLKLLEPIDNAISSIPIPGLSTLFSCSGMLEEVVDGAQDEFFKGVSRDCIKELKSNLEIVGVELGISAIEFD